MFFIEAIIVLFCLFVFAVLSFFVVAIPLYLFNFIIIAIAYSPEYARRKGWLKSPLPSSFLKKEDVLFKEGEHVIDERICYSKERQAKEFL